MVISPTVFKIVLTEIALILHLVEDIYYPTGGPLRGSVYRGGHATALQEGSIQRLEEGRKSPRRRRTGNERVGKVERGTE